MLRVESSAKNSCLCEAPIFLKKVCMWGGYQISHTVDLFQGSLPPPKRTGAITAKLGVRAAPALHDGGLRGLKVKSDEIFFFRLLSS